MESFEGVCVLPSVPPFAGFLVLPSGFLVSSSFLPPSEIVAFAVLYALLKLSNTLSISPWSASAFSNNAFASAIAFSKSVFALPVRLESNLSASAILLLNASVLVLPAVPPFAGVWVLPSVPPFAGVWVLPFVLPFAGFWVLPSGFLVSSSFLPPSEIVAFAVLYALLKLSNTLSISPWSASAFSNNAFASAIAFSKSVFALPVRLESNLSASAILLLNASVLT